MLNDQIPPFLFIILHCIDDLRHTVLSSIDIVDSVDCCFRRVAEPLERCGPKRIFANETFALPGLAVGPRTARQPFSILSQRYIPATVHAEFLDCVTTERAQPLTYGL
jgi:hypothetical protein